MKILYNLIFPNKILFNTKNLNINLKKFFL